MKVLQDTTEDWSKIIVCGGCKSKLEINSNDVKFTKDRHESIWGASNDWFTDVYYVVCGVCKGNIKLADMSPGVAPTKELPMAVIKKAFHRYFCR